MRHALSPAPQQTANKLLGLEALRFLTAFAILVFHYRHFSFVADNPVGLVQERLPLYGPLRALHESGAFGVWVFWCISGFIFFWKYRDPIAGRSVGGWKFFVLRFSRLYPLHLATLLLVALLQPVYFGQHGYFFVYQDNDLPHFLAQLFMAGDWGIVQGYSFDGVLPVLPDASDDKVVAVERDGCCGLPGRSPSERKRAGHELPGVFLYRRARGDGAEGGREGNAQIGNRRYRLACGVGYSTARPELGARRA
jgi:hypothetical protein